MKGPHKNIGVCRKDRFMVTTSLPNGSGISDLCGENKGQHCEYMATYRTGNYLQVTQHELLSTLLKKWST